MVKSLGVVFSAKNCFHSRYRSRKPSSRVMNGRPNARDATKEAASHPCITMALLKCLHVLGVGQYRRGRGRGEWGGGGVLETNALHQITRVILMTHDVVPDSFLKQKFGPHHEDSAPTKIFFSDSFYVFSKRISKTFNQSYLGVSACIAKCTLLQTNLTRILL